LSGLPPCRLPVLDVRRRRTRYGRACPRGGALLVAPRSCTGWPHSRERRLCRRAALGFWRSTGSAAAPLCHRLSRTHLPGKVPLRRQSDRESEGLCLPRLSEDGPALVTGNAWQGGKGLTVRDWIKPAQGSHPINRRTPRREVQPALPIGRARQSVPCRHAAVCRQAHGRGCRKRRTPRGPARSYRLFPGCSVEGGYGLGDACSVRARAVPHGNAGPPLPCGVDRRGRSWRAPQER
jgi:hypothetical protein